MKTHRCRYTQFILFYLSCLRADFAETFLATMVRACRSNAGGLPDPLRGLTPLAKARWRTLLPQISIMYDVKKNAVVRQAAAAYIASFVARTARPARKSAPRRYQGLRRRHCCRCPGCAGSAGCRNVSLQAAVDSIDKLRAWLTSYLDALESTVAYPDVGKYPLFYYPCQALMYIFCFRHAQLMGSRGTRAHGPSRPHQRPVATGLTIQIDVSRAGPRPPVGGEEYVRSLDLPRLINSRFNPLKVRRARGVWRLPECPLRAINSRGHTSRRGSRPRAAGRRAGHRRRVCRPVQAVRDHVLRCHHRAQPRRRPAGDAHGGTASRPELRCGGRGQRGLAAH